MNVFKAPDELIDSFVDGWNERDAERLASIFVEDAEFVNVTGLWWHTKERIYKAHEYGLRVIFKDSHL
ncbi:MAG: SgcJ/EcaC family oxidoreductase [Balneola sp.]